MKTKLTEQGLLIPRDWFGDIEEVEVRKNDNVITIVPAAQRDPILELGRQPVATEENDASVQHDRYLTTP